MFVFLSLGLMHAAVCSYLFFTILMVHRVVLIQKGEKKKKATKNIMSMLANTYFLFYASFQFNIKCGMSVFQFSLFRSICLWILLFIILSFSLNAMRTLNTFVRGVHFSSRSCEIIVTWKSNVFVKGEY